MQVRLKILAVFSTALTLLLFTGLQGANADSLTGGLLGPVLGPVNQVVQTVTAPIAGASHKATAAKSASVTSGVGSDDSPGHTTEAPSGPDHASGGIADADLAGSDLADASETNATIENDDSSHGDATVLSLLGNELIGAHSSSGGNTSDEFDILGPLCDATSGAVCVQLLYASTTSTEDATSSDSQSHTALAFVCLGGTATNADQPCDGPIGAGVGESHSRIHRDKTTGATTATQDTDAADVCLGGEDAQSELCNGLGVNALQARSGSAAGSQSGNGITARDSQLLGIESLGSNTPIVADPASLTIVPDCPPSLGVVCLYLNQGMGLVGAGSAGSRQEGLHLGLLNDTVLGHVSSAETLVSNHGPSVDTCDNGQPVPADGVCPGGPNNKPPGGGVPNPAPRGLAFTGANILIPFALALNLLVLGAFAMAWDRRRRVIV